MEVPQRFCVRWNSYKTNLQTAFPKLLTSEHFVDVTLACEKQYLKCHKVVLSACSLYFEDLLVNNPCQHPIIFMKDIAFWEMKALVEFMYKGEVNVSQEQLDSLLKSAESLQIRGLSGAKKWMGESAEPEVKRKRRGGDDDDQKSVQITSCDEKDDEDDPIAVTEEDIKSTDTTQDVKREAVTEGEDSAYLENTDDEGPGFPSEDMYQDGSREPGPSGMSDFSLALNSVECVMDQDRTKGESPCDSIGDKMAEHNYTYVNEENNMVTITRLSPNSAAAKQPSQNFRAIAPKPSSYTTGTLPVGYTPCPTYPVTYTSSTPPPEVKPKVTKKDVFNRIRRSEAELRKAAEMVRGGMTFQTASDTFNIPISTIRFYMARRGILPQRRRGRGSSGVRDDDLMHPPFEIIHYRLPDIDKPV